MKKKIVEVELTESGWLIRFDKNEAPRHYPIWSQVVAFLESLLTNKP